MNEEIFISPPVVNISKEDQDRVTERLADAKRRGLFAFYLPREERVVITPFAHSVIGGINLNLTEDTWKHLH